MQGNLDLNGYSIKNVANPRTQTDGVNKEFWESFLRDFLHFDGNPDISLFLNSNLVMSFNGTEKEMPEKLICSDCFGFL